jgi:hypothetical protein
VTKKNSGKLTKGPIENAGDPERRQADGDSHPAYLIFDIDRRPEHGRRSLCETGWLNDAELAVQQIWRTPMISLVRIYNVHLRRVIESISAN